MSDDSFYSACETLSSGADDSFDIPETLHDVLQKTFSNHSSFFNVCHINCQSIPAHYNDLFDSFRSSITHAILVSESWLKPQLDTLSYSLPGYILIRNDRTGKGGGGVGIYLRSDFKYNIISSSPSTFTGSAEYLFLEVLVNGSKVALGVVYCPPNTDYFSSFECALDSVSTTYSHIIIMGDFNTDLIKPSIRSQRLLDIAQSANLLILPSGATHHNLYSPDTLLDLILISSPSHVINHGSILASGFSRHDLIFLTYKLKSLKQAPVKLKIRCLNKINLDALDKDAAMLDLSNIYNAQTVDEKISNLNSVILSLFDVHAPYKLVKLKHPPAPWITNDVRKAMTRRDRAFRKFKCNRCDSTWENYKRARNQCNQLVRSAKRIYFHDNINKSSPSEIWKFLESVGIHSSSKNLGTCFIPLNDLNSHFASAPCLDNDIKANTIAEINGWNAIGSASDGLEPFFFNPVSVEEVCKTIKAINTKATGCDGLGRTMILPILTHLSEGITHIINTSLLTGVFPSAWCKAFVTPLPKIANPNILNHFRPISILPYLSKILEAVAHKQASRFVYNNDLLSDFQSGFRPGHSTTTALLKVTEDIRDAMERRFVTVLVLIDFSNAFNTVDYDILLALLKHLNFSSLAIEWFSSYLKGRQQAVRIGQSQSDWTELTSGVPQGGILSPLLFSIFINFVTPHINCPFHLYADDLQLYIHCDVKDIASAVSELNNNLENVRSWASRFGIKVNPMKCQAIIVGNKRQTEKLVGVPLPSIVFGDATIPYESTVKDLGLYIDCNFSWNAQIKEVCRKVTGALRSLNRFRNFLPIKTKITLVQSLIIPIIDYGDICYLDVTTNHLNKLDRLLNQAIRFIFCLRKFDHISYYRKKLRWLSIPQRRKLRSLCMVFSILFDTLSPKYLKAKFQFLGAAHNLNLRSFENQTLYIPFHRTNFIANSFALNAVRLWNKLPMFLRQTENKHTFKYRVYQHLLNGGS